MNGSLSITVAAARWNRAAIEQYLIVIAIGIVAGVLVAVVRQPLHLPGHKAIWWMPAIIASRLRTGRRGAATLGSVSALVTTALLGGRMPGGDLLFPMAIAGGFLFDLCTDRLARKRLGMLSYLFWFSIAGVVVNLLCLLTRVGGSPSSEIIVTLTSFAAFGIISGMMGCLLGLLPYTNGSKGSPTPSSRCSS